MTCNPELELDLEVDDCGLRNQLFKRGDTVWMTTVKKIKISHTHLLSNVHNNPDLHSTSSTKALMKMHRPYVFLLRRTTSYTAGGGPVLFRVDLASFPSRDDRPTNSLLHNNPYRSTGYCCLEYTPAWNKEEMDSLSFTISSSPTG
jgi:hypothetical protein